MRAALPAHFPVASRGVWLGLRAGLCGLAAASLIAWCGSHAQWGRISPAAAVLGGLLVALRVGGVLPARDSKGPRHCLCWDGSAWCLLGPDREAGHPQLMMDGGAWMLLRWHGQSTRLSVRWLSFSAADEPTAWHAFRVAVIDASRRPVPDVTEGSRS